MENDIITNNRKKIRLSEWLKHQNFKVASMVMHLPDAQEPPQVFRVRFPAGVPTILLNMEKK